mmetsp:Transcript_16559/g.25744  ORF Transcript_16559/g.25744 Transcript_16559/m.25744 type:complete len:372 (+) Transcript_16559:507-1622(+)
MREERANVLSTVRVHSERIEIQFPLSDACGGGTHEDTLSPVHGLTHKRDSVFSSATKDESRDGDTMGIVDLWVHNRAVSVRNHITRVRMSDRGLRSRAPGLAFPVDETFRGSLGHAFPPHIALFSETGVGEDGIRLDGLHNTPGLHVPACGDIIETRLGVDGIQLSISSNEQPSNIVSHTPHRPTRDGRNHHGGVGLSAPFGHNGAQIVLLSLWVGDTDNQTAGTPPLLTQRHDRSHTESITGLCQERVSTIGRPIGGDSVRVLFHKVGNSAVFNVARPRHILCSVLERDTHRVKTREEELLFGEERQHMFAHPGCLSETKNGIRRVSDLHSIFCKRGAVGTDTEGDNVHNSALHTPVHQSVEFFGHFFGV